MLDTLPLLRRQIMAFIRERVKVTGQFPSKSEIRDHMGWKGTAGVQDVLYGLRRRGLVEMTTQRAPVGTRVVQVWSVTEEGWR